MSLTNHIMVVGVLALAVPYGRNCQTTYKQPFKKMPR